MSGFDLKNLITINNHKKHPQPNSNKHDNFRRVLMNVRLNNQQLIAVIPWVFVLLWSTGFIGAKLTISFAEPYILLCLRGALSCLLFAAIAWKLNARWPERNSAVTQMITGFFLQTMFLGGCFTSINLGMPASATALITGMQPMLTAVIVVVLYKQPVRMLQWVGIALGFIGIYLVLAPSPSQNMVLNSTAIVAAVVGLIGITLGTLYQKSVNPSGHPITQVFYQSLSLTISMAMMTLLFEEQRIDWSPSFIFGLGWLVVVVGAGATLLLMFMIKSGESTRVATYFYLVPVFTALESWLLFNDTISSMGVIGMLTSVAGLFFVIKFSKKAVPESTLLKTS